MEKKLLNKVSESSSRMFSNLILFDQQSKTNNTQFTVNSNREAAAVTCWTLTPEEHHQSSLSSARSMTITQERLSCGDINGTYSQTVHMIRLNDSSVCFPESDFLKRESVGRDAAADEHLACFRRRYRHIWAVCLCVCVFIPPLPECPAVLCLQVETVWFAANDVAARWCERPGRGAAPQTPGKKKTHKTQVRDGNIPDSLTNVVILRVAASWGET